MLPRRLDRLDGSTQEIGAIGQALLGELATVRVHDPHQILRKPIGVDLGERELRHRFCQCMREAGAIADRLEAAELAPSAELVHDARRERLEDHVADLHEPAARERGRGEPCPELPRRGALPAEDRSPIAPDRLAQHTDPGLGRGCNN